jgi:vanillate O-demethylase ferredoxin subunit
VLEVIITRKNLEAVGIYSYELTRSNAVELPPFAAGAHIDVYLTNGLVRQYSLCNSPGERHRYLIAVQRDPGSRGGSIAMHDLHEGQSLLIGEPRNSFPLDESVRTNLLFAGGIGVTPLLSMAERLHEIGAEFELHYCARNYERMAFRQRISKAGFNERAYLHFDDGVEAQRLDLEIILADKSLDTNIYVCGPHGFIDYIASKSAARGWPENRIHREYFTRSAEIAEGQPFRIKIVSTGEIYDVPETKTVVDVLREAGIPIDVSCGQGICGTCLTPVLDGELIHRDMFMTDREHESGKKFTPCCSRGRGLVVLNR